MRNDRVKEEMTVVMTMIIKNNKSDGRLYEALAPRRPREAWATFQSTLKCLLAGWRKV